MMKTLIACTIVAIFVSGCAERQIKLVEVDKPIPMCPKPPVVPVCNFLVDQLTAADLKDPGKVGEAYKYDMTCLRTVDRINKLINQEYLKTSQNFDAVNEEISKSFKELSTKVEAAQKPVSQ